MASRRRALSPSMVAVVSMSGVLSVVVAGSADVAVGRVRGWGGGGAGQRLAVQGVLEDRLDAAVGTGPQAQRPGARGLDPAVAVPPGQADDAQRRAVALLGMRPGGKD